MSVKSMRKRDRSLIWKYADKMVKYIVILLDDSSTSFCHYDVQTREHSLISIDNLKAGVLYAMKENLNIQFVYPNYELPDEYRKIINTIDHTDIVPAVMDKEAEVIVFDDWNCFLHSSLKFDMGYVVRSTLSDLLGHEDDLLKVLETGARLNIVIKDIEKLGANDFEAYRHFLASLTDGIKDIYAKGKSPQLNFLTDRMMLDKMNNCNAGWESITLAPDGKFYVCPAFYYDGDYPIGSLAKGLDIKNPQLYRLDHAPICRHCDAWQCRRCIWLNKKTTLEVNTPSHEQCVMAHLERNASRDLLSKVRELGEFLPDKEIKEIDYLDPFDKRKDW